MIATRMTTPIAKAKIRSVSTGYEPNLVVPLMNEGIESALVPRNRLKVVTSIVERAMQTIMVRLKSAFMGLNRNLSTRTPKAAATKTVRGKATNPGNSSLTTSR